MPGVNPVQPRVQGGLLDTVLKGVTVARDVYGIKADMAQADLTNQKAEQQHKIFEDEQAGIQPASEKIKALQYGKQVDEGTPGAIKQQFKGDDSPLWLLANKAAKSTYPLPNYIDDQTGKAGTAFFDMNDPAAGPLYVAATQKPPKEFKPPTPHFTTTADSSGKLWKTNTLTGDVTPVEDLGNASFGKGAKDPSKEAAAAEKVYTELGQRIENPKGNKAVQTAQLNLLNIGNAKGLLSRYAGHLDDMPPNDVNLLVGELSKISTGGVGSEHTQEAIRANTLKSRVAGFMQQVGGTPSGAQLGAFLQNNAQYLDELEKVSNDRVNTYKMAIYNSYKNRLPQELQDRFQAEHGDLFPHGAHQPAAAAQPVAQGTGTGTAIAGPTLAPTKSGYMPGTVLDIGGVHYRVSDDGKTAVPVGGK